MTDLLVVSLGVSAGWQRVEERFAEAATRAGVDVRVERTRLGPERHLRRTMVGVDAIEAAGARRALRRGLRAGLPDAVVFLASTTSFMAPLGRLQRQGIRTGVRVDCPARLNRPGATGSLQRLVERRRLPRADVVLTSGPRSAEAVRGLARRVASAPPGIEADLGDPRAERGEEAAVYAADPRTRRLGLVADAWGRLGTSTAPARLVVYGCTEELARRRVAEAGVAWPERMEVAGMVPRPDFLTALARSRALVSASRFEGHGLCQLEALAAGTPLVTTPAVGAYEAEPIARTADPALVCDPDPEALATALSRALEYGPEDRVAYASRAAEGLRPFTVAEADRAMREEALPALLGYPPAPS